MRINLHKILQTRIKNLDKQIKEEIITRDSAPTPMQSGSDKTRQVAEQMIDSLLQEKKNLLNFKRILDNLPKFNNQASLNTIVSLKSIVEKKTFLLVPEGLGGVIVNGIFLLSINSPLAKKILNQKTGFSFISKDVTYQIDSTIPN